MRESLWKLFLIEDLSLNSIKIKVYISLVLVILADFILIFDIAFKELISHYLVISSGILMILALYKLSKISRNFRVLTIFIISSFCYLIVEILYQNSMELPIPDVIYDVYEKFYFIIYFFLCFINFILSFLYFKELFKISNEKFFLYCSYFVVTLILIPVLFEILILKFPSIEDYYTLITGILNLIFYFLELIAWIRFKSLKK